MQKHVLDEVKDDIFYLRLYVPKSSMTVIESKYIDNDVFEFSFIDACDNPQTFKANIIKQESNMIEFDINNNVFDWNFLNRLFFDELDEDFREVGKVNALTWCFMTSLHVALKSEGYLFLKHANLIKDMEYIWLYRTNYDSEKCKAYYRYFELLDVDIDTYFYLIKSSDNFFENEDVKMYNSGLSNLSKTR
jgi:hypothetical protein